VVNNRTSVSHGDNVFYKDRRVDHASITATTPPTSNTSVDNPRVLRVKQDLVTAAIPFTNAADLLTVCQSNNFAIAQVVFKNELQWRSASNVRRGLMQIWNVMNTSIMNGIHSTDEYLPGDLRVRRRAPILYRKLMSSLVRASGVDDDLIVGRPQPAITTGQPEIASSKQAVQAIPENKEEILFSSSAYQSYRRRLPALDWLSLYAIAVNEENAAGGTLSFFAFAYLYDCSDRHQYDVGRPCGDSTNEWRCGRHSCSFEVLFGIYFRRSTSSTIG
jgi:hypothetical protein